jgi:hypothetical protein
MGVARNRTIYNSQALYVSEQLATDVIGLHNIKQLSRIQSFDEDFTRNFTDVNQYGNLDSVDRIEVENPDVTASFSYYITDGQNEKKIGLNVYGSGTNFSDLTSCISGLLTKETDEKNYYLLITEEGFDASDYAGNQSGVIGVGNGFVTSYSINVAVGEIPTADVEIEGLNIHVYGNITGELIIPAVNPVDGNSFTNTFTYLPKATSITGQDIPTALQPGDIIFNLESDKVLGFDGADLKVQDFTLSFDLARTPLQKLGNRFAFSREIDFPVTATLEVNAEVGDLTSGNLADLLCGEADKDFTILMKGPGCGSEKSTALAYVFKGAKLVSQTFSSAIGDNVTMGATYEVQLGGPQDTDKGIFISGSYDPVLFEKQSDQILNSKFDKDNQYRTFKFDGNYNASGPSQIDSRILSYYDHMSPLLFEFQDNILYTFRTFANRTFHEINSPYNILPLNHELQPRLLKMFGAGSRFGVPDSYYSIDPDTNGNSLKTITSDPTTFSPTSGQSWVKYGVAQFVTIPSWATKVRFGVSYLVASNDQLRLNNFGGITLSFKKDNFRSYNNVYAVHTTDFNDPNSTNFSDLTNLLYNTGTYSFFNADWGQNAMCQWMGPNNSRVKVRRLAEFEDLVSNDKLDIFNTVNFTVNIPTFSTSYDEPDSADGFADAVSLEMFFAESLEYLNDDEVNSGAIYFYKPFIYFE